jgi:carbon monoxide dehydrogenase subunit G
MKMTGGRLLPVTPQQAWDALNDPAMLKDCIPGCESVTMIEPLHYELVMAAKVGPVSARFKGRLAQSDVVEPESYTIQFDGQGGAAGFGKGTAAVRLSPAEGGTRLDYDVTAQIGGKLAQIGSRLVDAAARKIAEEFFGNFEAKLRERVGTGAAAQVEGATAATTDAVGPRGGRRGSSRPVPLDRLGGRLRDRRGDHVLAGALSAPPRSTRWTVSIFRCCGRRATGCARAAGRGW